VTDRRMLPYKIANVMEALANPQLPQVGDPEPSVYNYRELTPEEKAAWRKAEEEFYYEIGEIVHNAYQEGYVPSGRELVSLLKAAGYELLALDVDDNV
jgi:hypothetical protein